MLGKIKKVLGIEGVKVQLILDTPVDKKNQKITGELKFTTKTKGKVTKINIKLIEAGANPNSLMNIPWLC